MFEVGFTELLLIMTLALIVLGPTRLPRVASQVGRWIGRARAMARQFREQLEEEANLDVTAPPKAKRSGAASTGGVPPAGEATASGDSPAGQPRPAGRPDDFIPGDDDFRHNDPPETKAPDERGT